MASRPGSCQNFKDVIIVASRNQYEEVYQLLESEPFHGFDRPKEIRSHGIRCHLNRYDSAIFNYFNREFQIPNYKKSIQRGQTLRYRENPHQKGILYGDLDGLFEQLNGKELSYNNLQDDVVPTLTY